MNATTMIREGLLLATTRVVATFAWRMPRGLPRSWQMMGWKKTVLRTGAVIVAVRQIRTNVGAEIRTRMTSAILPMAARVGMVMVMTMTMMMMMMISRATGR
jgi:hypothetical protein